KHAKNLGSYAVFLTRHRGDMDAAESYFKRAIEADPNNAMMLFQYAYFLQSERGDLDAAESYYKRLIAAEPNDALSLCNYGQLLAGQGRVKQAEKTLRLAFGIFVQSEGANMAEVCFSLWLVSRIQGHDAEQWERFFKFLIQQGFKRDPWSFERMIE